MEIGKPVIGGISGKLWGIPTIRKIEPAAPSC